MGTHPLAAPTQPTQQGAEGMSEYTFDELMGKSPEELLAIKRELEREKMDAYLQAERRKLVNEIFDLQRELE